MSNTDSSEAEISTSCMKPEDTIYNIGQTTNNNDKHLTV
jgi:hypothetical protein